MTNPELCSACLLELNNELNRVGYRISIDGGECFEVISQLLTYRKCLQRVRQRSGT